MAHHGCLRHLELVGERLIIKGNSSNGVAVTANTLASFDRSVIAFNGNGVQVTSGNGIINVFRSTIHNNSSVGVNVPSATGIIRVAENNIFNNGTGFAFAGGGQILSNANNRTGNNGGAQARTDDHAS